MGNAQDHYSTHDIALFAIFSINIIFVVVLRPKVLSVVGDRGPLLFYKVLKTNSFQSGCWHLCFSVRCFQRLLDSVLPGGSKTVVFDA